MGYEQMSTQMEWKKEDIKELLKKSDRAVVKGLLRIYSFQTQDEQQSETTRYRNGEGFNGLDAESLSGIASWYLKNKFLTKKQLAFVRRKIMKYAGQLVAVANGGM